MGDKVRQADGTTEIVWLRWNVEKTEEMYNLTVDEAHTFFVGDGQWLVHNTGLCPKSGIDSGFAAALSKTAEETNTLIFMRSRPEGAYKLDFAGIPFKPEKAENKLLYLDGTRYVKKADGTFARVLSDGDIAMVWDNRTNGWITNDDLVAPNLTLNKNGLPGWQTDPTSIGDRINYNYGAAISQHGAQSYYKDQYRTWSEKIYGFGANGYVGSGNFAQIFGHNQFPPFRFPGQ